MISKFKSLISRLSLQTPNVALPTTPIFQQDVRAHESVKRTRAIFNQNEELILSRSLRPHSADCKDPDTCTQDPCWEFVPDKIVSELYIVREPKEEPVYCEFHYKGGMFESLGYEICPCSCHCQNCEMIPESELYVRMQDIAQNMGEENVFNEFIDQYAKKDLDGIREQS